jgi:SP family arabinose:H+ symporter-like MFS transporter
MTPSEASVAPSVAPRTATAHGYAWILATAAALGGLMFGFDIAIITGAGPFIEREFGLDHLALGWAFSSLLFGCVVGAAAAGALLDRLGRRPLLVAVALVFGVTTVMTGAATDFDGFVLARFLGGLAVGAVSLAAPAYVAEVAPARLRGRMGALYQMAIVTGILLSYLINYLLRDAGPDAWRLMFYTGVAPAGLFLLLMLFAPESPRHLVRTGRTDAAAAILRRIGEAEPERQLKEIAQSLAQPRLGLDVLRQPHLRAPLRVTAVLAVLIHLCGINTIIDYAPVIFRSAGFSMDAALFSTFVVGAANFAFTLISFWTIDRFGRRPLYLAGSIGMAATLLALVGAVLTGSFEGPAALGLIVAYLFFFASCIGPVFWTLLPELFPNSSRGAALAVPVLLQWIANAVVVLVFPSIFHGAGQAATFAILAMACIAQALFTWAYVPETKGRSLEEISARWKAKA